MSCLIKFLLVVLTSIWVDASVSMHNPFYCYSQDPIRPQTSRFSIISTYETNRGNIVTPTSTSCTPAKFWFISRHGTRLPTRAQIAEIIEESATLQRDIINNYEAGRTSLCASDIELIRNWRFDPNITEESTQLLTVAGWNEFRDMAQRYQAAFPTLLPSTYSPSHYFFRSVETQRALGSMRAFADGLFGYNEFENVAFENVENPDLVLLPHDHCPEYVQVSTVFTQQQEFVRGPEYQQMLSQVSAKLGFHGSESLRNSSVTTLMNLCRYEQIWNINGMSPMCAAFSAANHQVLEYFEDLQFYYRLGYGNAARFRTLYEGIYCRVMKDLLSFIQSTDPNDHTAKLFSGHTAIQLLYVTLGVFEDDEVLTQHNFAQQTFRQWRTSRIATKGTNLVMIRFDCVDDDNDIMFLLNERPLQIPGCDSNGICKQAFVLERFSRFANGNCDEIYCRNS